MEEVKKELQDHIDTLNEKDEEGEEVFSQYRMTLDFNDNEPEKTTADLVREADLDNVDFNIGFEQGYMRGLEVALSHLTMKTTSILDIAKNLIQAIEEAGIDTENIRHELFDLKEWVREGKLEERITE
jgi:hypothetical protein